MNYLQTLAAELEAARQDLALFQRLTSAEERVEQLTRDYDKGKAAHDREEAKKAEAVHAARFTGLSNIRVEHSGRADSSLTNKVFTISWTQPAWDTWLGASVLKRHTVNGFAGLSPKVMAFLLEAHPEQIPAEIMALAPGDPEKAMATYLAGIRRGYFIAKVSA